MTAPPTEGLLALDRTAQDLLFRSARTANTFTTEPVTGDELRAIHDLAKYGPTAFNAQPLRIVPAGLDAEFFPDGRLRSLLVVSIGHPGPDAWDERLPRLDADDVLYTL